MYEPLWCVARREGWRNGTQVKCTQVEREQEREVEHRDRSPIAMSCVYKRTTDPARLGWAVPASWEESEAAGQDLYFPSLLGMSGRW
jgi:hypothetical protein